MVLKLLHYKPCAQYSDRIATFIYPTYQKTFATCIMYYFYIMYT